VNDRVSSIFTASDKAWWTRPICFNFVVETFPFLWKEKLFKTSNFPPRQLFEGGFKEFFLSQSAAMLWNYSNSGIHYNCVFKTQKQLNIWGESCGEKWLFPEF
jgi:hypothetical protein